MKIRFILFLFILTWVGSSLYAEDSQKDVFSLTLKRGLFHYSPAEHHALEKRDFNIGGIYPRIGRLKNNEDQINFFTLGYLLKDRWLIEFSLLDISVGNSYYKIPFGNFSLNSRLTNQYNREDNKLNFSFNLNSSNKHLFNFGGGVRRIFKETSRRTSLDENTERVNSLGIQGLFRYNYFFTSSVFAGLSVEPFYTQGRRDYRPSIQGIYSNVPIGGSILALNPTIYNPNTKLLFYGADLDFSLGYRINDKISILVGYNFIYTKRKYENLNDRNFGIQITEQGYTLLLNDFYSNRTSHDNDHIYGYYLGLKAEF